MNLQDAKIHAGIQLLGGLEDGGTGELFLMWRSRNNYVIRGTAERLDSPNAEYLTKYRVTLNDDGKPVYEKY